MPAAFFLFKCSNRRLLLSCILLYRSGQLYSYADVFVANKQIWAVKVNEFKKCSIKLRLSVTLAIFKLLQGAASCSVQEDKISTIMGSYTIKPLSNASRTCLLPPYQLKRSKAPNLSSDVEGFHKYLLNQIAYSRVFISHE